MSDIMSPKKRADSLANARKELTGFNITEEPMRGILHGAHSDRVAIADEARANLRKMTGFGARLRRLLLWHPLLEK